MTNRDDIQRDLQALLAAANPSPAFAAAVRTRVAEGAARRSHRAACVWALGGAVCLASLVWALSAPTPAATTVPAGATTASAALARPQGPAATVRPPARARQSHIGDRLRSAGVPRTPADVEIVSAEAGDSRVLVPDDQRIALVYLLRRLHEGRATVPASIVPAYDKDGLLVPPELIVIAPLASLTQPDPDDRRTPEDPKGPGKDKQR